MSGKERLWDVAIIGGGMGGGMAAHALAKAGHEVLLIEYGNEDRTSPDAATSTNDAEARLAQNKWPITSAYEVDGVITHAEPTLGAGIGGSTNLYAAALERFAQIDIDACAGHPTRGWPIRYSELLPYYEEAERLLHVIGTQDPSAADQGSHILPPPPLGPCDDHFMRVFAQNGLHPYRLHVGIRYRPGCDECLGRLCYQNCRADARSVLAESVSKPTIMARTEVVKLEASGDRVSSAIVRRDGQHMEIHARIFILAAGAIHSPKLLLRSSNEYWRQGLANRSGMVGRNLMFHATLAFSLWPDRKYPSTGPRKSISFRDFYEVDGQRCGSVQSTGFEFGYGGLLVHLYNRFDQGRLKRLRPLRPLLRIQAAVANRMTGPGTIFVGIIEDLPYPENRVVLDDNEADGVLIKYTIKQELRDRTALLRDLLQRRLQDQRMLFLTQGVELNYGHPCGTCVMNDDPSRGVPGGRIVYADKRRNQPVSYRGCQCPPRGGQDRYGAEANRRLQQCKAARKPIERWAGPRIATASHFPTRISLRARTPFLNRHLGKILGAIGK
jgi:choline dehydrogenase-like flavoprotein